MQLEAAYFSSILIMSILSISHYEVQGLNVSPKTLLQSRALIFFHSKFLSLLSSPVQLQKEGWGINVDQLPRSSICYHRVCRII